MKDKILLAHGGGGKLMHDLIREVMLKPLSNPILEHLDDSGVIELDGKKVAFSTDSYVVNPLFFRGGDIGKLAVYGTVNDLAMVGATPLYLSLSLIIEEGFPTSDLKRIMGSIAKASQEAKVLIAAGDTKVVESGKGDGVFITSSGIGIIPDGVNISSSNAKIGDKVIISGSIGEHGICIMSEREGLDFKANFSSDSSPLNSLVSDMLKVTKEIHCLRDPTRGGLSATLNEIAIQSNVGILIYEDKVLIREEVKGACELLGLDPFYVANEGKLVAVVPANHAEAILISMRKNRYGQQSTIIGEVVNQPRKVVALKTSIGGRRILDMLVGEQLPRIC